MSGPRSRSVNLYAFEKMWDNGFRQMTTSGKAIEQAADMASLKIRVPVSPLSISMFKALGAAPGQPAVLRGLFGAADQGGRRAGEPAADHPGRQAL
jgi:TRAP-type mannitol/chloroaromatic compound transport system substrate-binding protein